MSLKMRITLMIAITSGSCLMHSIDNKTVIDRNNIQMADAQHNNHNRNNQRNIIEVQSFVQNSRNGHLIVKQSSKIDHSHFFGYVIIPCK